MNKGRLLGLFLCTVATVAAGLFLWGIVRGEPWRFWAIATPVIFLFGSILLFLFWVGWALATSAPETPSRREQEKKGAASPPAG